MPEAPTKRELRAYCKSLNRQDPATPVITQYTDANGQIVALPDLGGGYNVGYGRYSTAKQGKKKKYQALDGLTDEQQLVRLIDYLIDLKQPFRIVTDWALTGGMPYDEPYLIETLLDKKAIRFDAIFRNVALSDYNDQFTKEQKAAFREYLSAKIEAIRAGTDKDAKLDLDAQREEAVRQWGRRTRRNKPLHYRPGLTLIVRERINIRRLVVTDMSRLCRSQMLWVDLGYKLSHVQFVGLIDAMPGQNEGGELLGIIMAFFHEQQLKAVLMNSLRGIIDALSAGRPHGSLPFFLCRDSETGTARVREKYRACVELIIGRYMETEETGERGFQLIASELDTSPYLPPRDQKTYERLDDEPAIEDMDSDDQDGTPHRSQWRWQTVRGVLRSTLTFGHQRMFGWLWPVMDDAEQPIIDRVRWQEIQNRMSVRARVFGWAPPAADSDPKSIDWYLMKGMMRCWCGMSIVHKPHQQVEGGHYVCQLLLRARTDKSTPHVFIPRNVVDSWMNNFMRYDPKAVLGDLVTPEMDALRLNLEQMELQLAQLEALRESKELAARTEAEKAIMDNSNYEVVRRKRELTVELVMVEFETEIHTLGGQIEKLRDELRGFSPDQAVSLEERIAGWERQEPWDQNDILCRLFLVFQWERDDGGERMVPVRRTPEKRTLPPIEVRVVRKRWRRLPSLEDYYASAFIPSGT